MRPKYETLKDLKNEKEIIEHVKRAWVIEVRKLSIDRKIDFAGYRGGVLCMWLEVKRRFVRRRTYKTFFISLAKVDAGLELERKSTWPFYLVIGWDDGIYYLRVKRERIVKIETGGRDDRNDFFDKEPMAHFDVEMFRGIP